MGVLFAFTNNDHWTPGIGDPTFLGWFTTLAYFAAAFVCWLAARKPENQTHGNVRLFWLGFVLFMFLLGINKQLDLQTFFTLTGKQLAKQGGWYEQRRLVQAVFISVIALGGAVALGGLWFVSRKLVRQHRPAVLGAVFLICFVLIRAASFHHVDQMLGLHFGHLRMNHVLELGGIFWVTTAGVLERRRGPGNQLFNSSHE